MNTISRTSVIRTSIVAAAAAAGLTLTGCSSGGHAERQSFDLTGSRLDVVNDNANMEVTVTSGTTDGEVVVEVSTQTLGRGAETPAWSLADGVLDLDSPCGGSVVGYCEGSYEIQVPEGVEVWVNGRPASDG